jgi:hypothetical protein
VLYDDEVVLGSATISAVSRPLDRDEPHHASLTP